MKVKGFSFLRVKTRRDNLFAHALQPYIGARIVGETVTDICEDLSKQLPQTISRDALFESVRVMAGTTLSLREAKDLAWRLAGNINRLNAGERVLPWTRQIADEVVPVRVERIHADMRRNRHGYTLHCRALAGSSCPMVFPQFFSPQSCRAISRTLGFSATWGPYPFRTPLYFMGLMFFAHIEADKSGETPYFKTVSGSSGLVDQNRPKIAVRCRNKPCPRGYQHDCEKCWLGQDECPAGIYPKSLVQRECAKCVNIGFFEPDDEEGRFCMNCRAAHQA
jgi:hypothetical protein